MATLTVLLPGPLQAWVEDKAGADGYDSPADYVRDLIRRDREREGEALSIEEVRALVADAKVGGVSTRSIDDIFAEAVRLAKPRSTE